MLTLSKENQVIAKSEDQLFRLGKGGEGTVYRVSHDRQTYALKIYHSPTLEKEKKIRAMLALRPKDTQVKLNNLSFVQLAWPEDLVYRDGKFVGFVMPYVDSQLSQTLEHYLDPVLLADLERVQPLSLPQRLEIARNIAAVVGLLHEAGICFIDFKPQNIRIYSRYLTVSFIDCDGFSINNVGGSSYPALSYSSEYISPEAIKGSLRPADLDAKQDLFALAVVIFQLLNYGIHPFSGISAPGIAAATTDDKVAKGLYPYGRIPNPQIAPQPMSVHECFPEELRVFFDKAFAEKPIYAAAKDWVSLIDRILNEKELTRCEKFPDDIKHIRFDQHGCLTCLRDSRADAVRNAVASEGILPTSSGRGLNGRSVPKVSGQSAVPTQSDSSSFGAGTVVLLVILGIVLVMGMLSRSGNNSSTPSSDTSVLKPAHNGVLQESDASVRIVLYTRTLVGAYASDCSSARHYSARIIYNENQSRYEYHEWRGKREYVIKNLEDKGNQITGVLSRNNELFSAAWDVGTMTIKLIRLVRTNPGPELAIVMNGFFVDPSVDPNRTEIYKQCSSGSDVNPPSDKRDVGGPSSQPAVNGQFIGYGAVYVTDSRAFSWVIGYPTQAQADAAAEGQCRKLSDAHTCRRFLGARSNCVAIARSVDGAAGVMFHPSASAAESLALEECAKQGGRDCKILKQAALCQGG